MKNKIYKFLAFIFYFLSVLILLYCIKIRLTKGIYLKTNYRMLMLLISSILIYLGGYILVKKLNCSKKILKINLIIYFIIYIVTILTLTLFDEIFGRQGITFIKWNDYLLKSYMNTSFNIIPFKTIKLFIRGYKVGIVSLKNFSINIIGNFVGFMPCAVFIPLLFRNINKYYKFLITMILIVLLIEILQFMTMSGSCDVDDLILNVLGASIVYFITKIKFVNRFIHKIFLYE